MKNYLKKAISAVIALALAASMVPATLAANVALTDVPETADYATAVNALVALKVINGYEDNSFKPDNQITRAEASKVIVAALNETASAEAMKGATKFSDIEAKHEWATGYINKGVSMGYINGMENNQFQPDGNVTFAQVVKMMLCAMGYEDYAVSLAEQYGYTGANWYIPYTQLAADAGVTEGVYAGPNEAVTRAQVAQLVYNAMQAPMVKNTGVTYTDGGKIVPKIQIQDGEQSTYYKSILTEKFDAYYVEGYVTATSKDDGSGLKPDEVSFGIAKSKKYDQGDVSFTKVISDYATVLTQTTNSDSSEDRILNKVFVGDTDAANNKGVYATAIIALDAYDDWTLLNFVPSGKNKTVTFNLKDLDITEFENADETPNQTEWAKYDTYLKFFEDGAKVSTKYTLLTTGSGEAAVPTTVVYVNGVKVVNDSYTAVQAVWDYVINNKIGEVTLVDTYKTDGKYDTIYVDKYVSAMVDSVTSADKVIFKDDDLGVGSVTLDDEIDEVEFHIYYNGEEITINDLQKNDVLTIAYNVRKVANNDKESFRKSDFYEIYVSRDVVNDTLKGKRDEDFEAKFGDTYYEFARADVYNSNIKGNNATLGNEYTLYLDAFGRVYKCEINNLVANWGVADKFYLPNGDDEFKLTIFTADGATKQYYVDKKVATEANIDVIGAAVYGSTWNASTNAGSTKNDLIQNRVVTYKVSNLSGKITSLTFETPSAKTDDAATSGTYEKKEFKSKNNSIGAIKLGDASKIVDATKRSENTLTAITVADLTDGVNYEAYAYGDKINDIHPFVLIRTGDAKYNENTRFAVITEAGYAEVEDETTGDYLYEISAMYGDNEDGKLIVSDDVDTKRLDRLYVGDVIFFTTTAGGYIKDFDKIFTFGSKLAPNVTTTPIDPVESIAIPTQATLTANSIKENNAATGIKIENTFVNTKFSSDFTTSDQNDLIKFVYGPVVERTDNSITIGKIAQAGAELSTSIDNTTVTYPATGLVTDMNDENSLIELDFRSDVRVYTYDYSASKDYRFNYSNTSVSAINPTRVLEKYMIESGDHDYIPWNLTVGTDTPNDDSVTFAFAMVQGDEVIDILAFVAE